MTLQTFAVLAIGMAYGARLSAATLFLYMLEGMAGLPVFAQMKSGLATVLGPSGGYIVGFILAAGFLGFLAERGWDRGRLKAVAAAVICGALIYVPGLAWLHTFAADWGQTLEWGLTPFIIVDLIKTVFTALLIRSAGIWHVPSYVNLHKQHTILALSRFESQCVSSTRKDFQDRTEIGALPWVTSTLFGVI